MFVIAEQICKNLYNFSFKGIWHVHILEVEKIQAEVIVQHIRASLTSACETLWNWKKDREIIIFYDFKQIWFLGFLRSEWMKQIFPRCCDFQQKYFSSRKIGQNLLFYINYFWSRLGLKRTMLIKY